MKLLNATFTAPEHNLACDEALLNLCVGGVETETLRFWESPHHFVVLGYTNGATTEINLEACRQLHVPVLRRCSGGGAVVQGPGCLNYSLVLRVTRSVALQTIGGTNAYVLGVHKRAFEPLTGSIIDVAGTSDLAIENRKFSGSAQRRRGEWVLFHGTCLLDFDLSIITQLLPSPSKEPAYRRGRTHEQFLTNLHLSPSAVKESIRKAWGVGEVMPGIPADEINDLVRSRYSQHTWTFRF